ncbi:hypothetical protein OAT85_00525 [Gammaproteobacteria bacterium]|nr:hypothetical protein [Gammaproteobacteria bacterium]
MRKILLIAFLFLFAQTGSAQFGNFGGMLDNAKKELEKAGDVLKSQPSNKIESKESTSVAHRETESQAHQGKLLNEEKERVDAYNKKRQAEADVRREQQVRQAEKTRKAEQLKVDAHNKKRQAEEDTQNKQREEVDSFCENLKNSAALNEYAEYLLEYRNHPNPVGFNCVAANLGKADQCDYRPGAPVVVPLEMGEEQNLVRTWVHKQVKKMKFADGYARQDYDLALTKVIGQCAYDLMREDDSRVSLLLDNGGYRTQKTFDMFQVLAEAKTEEILTDEGELITISKPVELDYDWHSTVVPSRTFNIETILGDWRHTKFAPIKPEWIPAALIAFGAKEKFIANILQKGAEDRKDHMTVLRSAREQHIASTKAAEVKAQEQQKQQAEESEAQRVRAEYMRTPAGKLQGLYIDYQVTKGCYDSRKGKAVVYITSTEADRAKTEMKKAEKKLASGNAIDKDEIWNKAYADVKGLLDALAIGSYTDDLKGFCGMAKIGLSNKVENIIGDAVPQRP